MVAAVLITIIIFQHFSINVLSVCTLSHVRNYFLTGTLPPEGIVCPVLMPPSPPVNKEDSSSDVQEGLVVGGSRGKEMVFETVKGFGGSHESEMATIMRDEKFKEAVVELSKVWRFSNMPLSG